MSTLENGASTLKNGDSNDHSTWYKDEIKLNCLAVKLRIVAFVLRNFKSLARGKIQILNIEIQSRRKTLLMSDNDIIMSRLVSAFRSMF